MSSRVSCERHGSQVGTDMIADLRARLHSSSIVPCLIVEMALEPSLISENDGARLGLRDGDTYHDEAGYETSGLDMRPMCVLCAVEGGLAVHVVGLEVRQGRGPR